MIKVAKEELNLINAGSRYKIGKGYSRSLGLASYRSGCNTITSNFVHRPYEELISSIPEGNKLSMRFVDLFTEVDENGLIIGCKPYDFKKICSLLGECHKIQNSRR